MKIQAFDFSVNLLRALLWQHNEAARLESLLTLKQAWYDAENKGFWDNWTRDVFDLRTANEFGLSVWAIILNMPLSAAALPDPDSERVIWGFAADDENYTNGNFEGVSGIPLTTTQVRLILRLRYFQLVTRGVVPEINSFIGELFAEFGSTYVVDGLNMTARYVFGFELSPDLQTVLSAFDLLPRPAGVMVDYVVISDSDGWGFGRYHFNFNNGNFYHA